MKLNILKKKIKNKQIITILFMILIFIILNGTLFLTGASGGDVSMQQSWGNHALKNGIASVYLTAFTDYPPLYMYVLKFNAWLNQKLFGHTNIMSASYLFISKTIPTLCNLLIGLLVFFYLRKKNYKIALIAMCLYLFNPAVIYNTAYWGQVDSVNTLFMFLSIILLIYKKYISSTIFIILAVLTKIQSIVLFPVVGIIILMNLNIKEILKLIIVNIFVIISILLPYIFAGALPYVIRRFFPVGYVPYATINAYNLWWFLTKPSSLHFPNTVLDTSTFIGLSLKKIGLILLGIYTLLVIYQLLKNKDSNNIVLAAVSMAFAFFMLPTEIHERYLFPFFALASLTVLKNKKFLIVYILSSITSLLNLMVCLPFNNTNFIFGPIQAFLNFLINNFSVFNVAFVISAINVLVFVYFSKIGIFNGLLLNFRKDFLEFKKFIVSKLTRI